MLFFLLPNSPGFIKPVQRRPVHPGGAHRSPHQILFFFRFAAAKINLVFIPKNHGLGLRVRPGGQRSAKPLRARQGIRGEKRGSPRRPSSRVGSIARSGKSIPGALCFLHSPAIPLIQKHVHAGKSRQFSIKLRRHLSSCQARIHNTPRARVNHLLTPQTASVCGYCES